MGAMGGMVGVYYMSLMHLRLPLQGMGGLGGMNNSQLSNMWGGMAGRGPLAMGGGRGNGRGT